MTEHGRASAGPSTTSIPLPIETDRPSFGAALQSAVDVANGEARTDLRPGAMATTGRPMDVAIQGSGFFVVKTPQGERYTRNGHLVRGIDGTLSTDEGDPVIGTEGPITIDTGTVSVDPDGTVRNGASIAGKLKIVDLGLNPGATHTSSNRQAPVTNATPKVASASAVPAAAPIAGKKTLLNTSAAAVP